MERANTYPYTKGSVRSADGTIIGYRQLGHGPAIILVHGGMMASQNFMKLAATLSDAFTVYVPDRRDRGVSEPYRDSDALTQESQDMQSLAANTGATCIFGLSSGAIVALQAALATPTIHKIALYEPPLPLKGAPPAAWITRYGEELAQNKLAEAMVSVMRGTGDSSLLARLPRFVVTPFLRLAIKADAKTVDGDDVPLGRLIPTMHYDLQIVASSEGLLERCKDLRAELLLLGGSKSQAFLKTALNALQAAIPQARRVECPGVGHLAADNSGEPERVAQELRAFFSESQPLHGCGT